MVELFLCASLTDECLKLKSHVHLWPITWGFLDEINISCNYKSTFFKNILKTLFLVYFKWNKNYYKQNILLIHPSILPHIVFKKKTPRGYLYIFLKIYFRNCRTFGGYMKIQQRTKQHAHLPSAEGFVPPK